MSENQFVAQIKKGTYRNEKVKGTSSSCFRVETS